MQALCEGSASQTASGFLGGAVRYLKQAQMSEEVPERKRYYQDRRLGGFCFSDERHQWPVSDCTAESLSALAALESRLGPEAQLEPARIVEAVRFVLSRQNSDGGWGSFERRRGPLFLERLNPFEMFANCMVEHSYIECTGSCLHGLRRVLECFEEVLPSEECARVCAAMRKGADWLRKQQQRDGSWPGCWGVHFTMAEFAHQLGFRQSLGRKGEDVMAACPLPQKAALDGIEMHFEQLIAQVRAQIVVIAPKIEPSVGPDAAKPATGGQIRKDPRQVEHVGFPFWPIEATRVFSLGIGL